MTDLQCPASCLRHIASGQVATATVNLTRTTSYSLIAVPFLSSSPLLSLTIDFYQSDHDVLTRIVSAAPLLRKLKLIEKPRAQVCRQATFVLHYILTFRV